MVRVRRPHLRAFRGQLFKAVNPLLNPPASVDDLLPLLSRLEHCLSIVENRPPFDVKNSLCQAFEVLVTPELMNHTDIDVRVGVTACLIETLRISAPYFPYNSQLMKDVFSLTVSAFEGLSDESSNSFAKRVSILECVARARFCSVLPELDCDGLVVKMFQNFYKCIRDFHTANVFASMESIMTLVIEKYEEISADLLFALISVLKRDNKDAAPVAKRLGEKVVERCANKLKLCIIEAIQSLTIDLLDYDFVVTLTCQSAPDHDPLREHTPNVPLVNGGESFRKSVEKEVVFEASSNLSPHNPPIGNTVIVDQDAAAERILKTSHQSDSNVVGCDAETIQDHVQVGQAAATYDMVMNLEAVSISKHELKSEENANKKEHKPVNPKGILHRGSSKLPEPDGKKASECQVSETSVFMEVLASPHHNSSVDPNVPGKSHDSRIQLSPKAVEFFLISRGPPSQTDVPSEKDSSELIKRSEQTLPVQEATSSHQTSEKNTYIDLNDSETVEAAFENVTSNGVCDASKFVSSVETKNIEGVSHLGITDGNMRTGKQGRPHEDASMSTAAGVKEGISSEGTSRKRSRLRFTFPEEGKIYGEDLIGTRIKIWWPLDREYYGGIVKAYDPIKREHMILYTDNERESLPLHEHKWKLLKSSIGSEKATTNTNAGDIQVPLEKATLNGVGDAPKFVSSVVVKNKQDTEGDSHVCITDGTLKSKKRGSPCEDASMSAVTGVKEGIYSEGPLRKRSRLRFTFPEEGELYGGDLIGTRIKVWWPGDRKYYNGIVESYNPIKKRHLILFADNLRESIRLDKQKWKILKSSIGSEKVTANTNAAIDSEKCRGRPAKNHASLASYDSPVKSSMSEGHIQPSEKQKDNVADDGNPTKSMNFMPQWPDVPTLKPENEQDVLPENAGTQTKQNTSMCTGVDTTAPKSVVRFDMDDPVTYRIDDVGETATPETVNAIASETEEIKSGSATEARTAGLNRKFPASVPTTGANTATPLKKRLIDELEEERRVLNETIANLTNRRNQVTGLLIELRYYSDESCL